MSDTKIVASLIWYDESPAWLSAVLHGIVPHIDHLVAIDGAYFLYPEGRNWSRPDQHETILYSCQAAGIGLTLHTPSTVWFGNEVEKRTNQLELALRVAEPNRDWVMIVDSDEVVQHWPEDTIDRLAATDLDVAEVRYVEHHPASMNPDFQEMHFSWGQDHSDGVTRNLFRALPDLSQGHNHFTVHGGNQTLRGNMSVTTLAPALDLKDLVLDHRTNLRPKHRHDSQYTYYNRRDSHMVEADTCWLCREQGKTVLATQHAQKDWEREPVLDDNGEPIKDQWVIVSGWMEVCADCKPLADQESERRVRELSWGQKGLADMQIQRGKFGRQKEAA